MIQSYDKHKNVRKGWHLMSSSVLKHEGSELFPHLMRYASLALRIPSRME